ncbi:MAG: DUF3592 domain-containing protein [Roseiflexaceae bacterium]|nr:DUF3592 domain-containing protein [Roseiflexaceae bacterium]
MSLGSSAEDFGLAILVLLVALFASVLLFGISVLLGRMVGDRSGGVALVLASVTIVGLLVGGSLYLDSAGRTVDGLVETKDEQVELRRQGDWRHDLIIQVRYRLDGNAPSLAQATSDDGAASLRLAEPVFDQLRAAEPVALKVLPLYRSLTLVRLANTNTRDYIPWTIVAIVVGILVFGWLAFRIGRSTTGCLTILLVALVAGIGVPSAVIYQQWQASENLATKPLRAEARVSEVTRVTKIDPFPCSPGGRSNCSRTSTEFDVPQQYDIVRMVFVPQGGRDEIVAIDAADVGSAQVEVGSNLQIAYAPGNPRAAQIIGATHTHHWRNLLGFAGGIIGIMGVGLALLVAVFGLLRRAKRATRTPTP